MNNLFFFTAKCLSGNFFAHNELIQQTQNCNYPVSDFRVGAEISSTPFVFLLFDLVLTGNSTVDPSENSQYSTLLKCLAIHCIRQKLVGCKTITMLQKVLSNEVSLTCSKSLMTVLNKSGLSFSYSKDMKDSKRARQIWNNVGLKKTLQNIPSNMHSIECDNLETMLKSASIHNAERLTHFLTSQLEYVKGQYVTLDLFKKPPVHDMDASAFHVTPKEKQLPSKFLTDCHKKVTEHKHLSCDEMVSRLAMSGNNET